jgi:thiazole synthase
MSKSSQWRAEADLLRIGKREFSSRLLLGTGKFASNEVMLESVRASGTQLVTVALRRFNPEMPDDDLLSPLRKIKGLTIMPNTSGARTAEEAIKTAQVARELCGSEFVKLEIHPNPHHLLPDPIETFRAAEVLCKEGFTVLPYMPADPVLAKRLEEVGCAAVMPLGSPIGTGKGLETSAMIRIIIANSAVPVIVDAGLRSPGEAAIALEMGCDAVLVNSAVAAAGNPRAMAEAFAQAVTAGRAARAAGLMNATDTASPTSPITSFLNQ